jgi:hypothetical protein
MANPITDAITGLITGLAKPVADVIDELHTSEEERLTLKQKFFELQVALYSKVMDYEGKIIDAQASVIKAEAESESWLASNWRPLTMMTFLVLIVNKWTGLSIVLGWPQVFIDSAIEQRLWDCITLGLGGYVVGRSLEKIAPSVAEALGNMKKQ